MLDKGVSDDPLLHCHPNVIIRFGEQFIVNAEQASAAASALGGSQTISEFLILLKPVGGTPETENDDYYRQPRLSGAWVVKAADYALSVGVAFEALRAQSRLAAVGNRRRGH